MPRRRDFLKTIAAPAAATAAGFPTIVQASALGLNGAVAASNRVTLATIGVGWMGGGHVEEFLKNPNVQYIGVCDLDEEHAREAKTAIDKKYGNQNCVTYRAFEELLSRKDLDAVSIAVPDHWHGIVAYSAARAGKDIYCEKPLAHNFREGRAAVEAAAKYDRIWQTGSWQRSTANFRQACELVRNNRVGKVRRIEVGLPAGWTDFDKSGDQMTPSQPPATIDYDRWLGPAAEMPFIRGRFHKNWRWNLNFGGGQIMDWVGHHVDIAHWGMGWDETGPYEIKGKGDYPNPAAPWNSVGKYWVECKYPGDVTLVMAGGYPEIKSGTKWIGDDGWIHVDRGRIAASNPDWVKPGADTGPVKLMVSSDHYVQFIECVKSRAETITPGRVALHSATPGWLGQISMLTARTIRWDAVTMKILNDPGAAGLLGREQRMPWHLA